MELPVLSQRDVLGLLDLPVLVAEMRAALLAGERQRAVTPLRALIRSSAPHAAFGAMPSYSPERGLFVVKSAAFVAHGLPLPAVGAVVSAFSALTAQPLAVLEGAALTQIKCRAAAALVTDCCALPAARSLACVGAGDLAFQQLLAVCSVREIREVRVCSRTEHSARRFIARGQAALRSPVQFALCGSAQQAVTGADVVCTGTTAVTPLFQDCGLAEHVHINCMGAHTPHAREVPEPLIGRSLLVVEDRATAVAEAGRSHDSAFELEQLVRLSPQRLQGTTTLFSSTGHAFLDLLATAHVLARAGVQMMTGPSS
jgi:ornithine cyclodeaminase